MKKYSAVSAFAALATTAAFVSFTACGDDVTQITENYETGAETVKKKSELPHCNSTKIGAIVFVTDSAQVFVCDGTNWASLQGADGKDGAPGERGAQGDRGASGEGCSAESITKDSLKGFVVTCGDVVDTLWNGRDGEDGKDGAPGSSGSKGDPGDKGDPGSSGAKGETGDPGSSGSQGPQGVPGSSGAQGIPGSSGAGCVATQVSVDNRTGVAIVCGDESKADTLWNGADGEKGKDGAPGSSGSQGPQGVPGSSGAQGVAGVGCRIDSDEGGVITIVCGEGEKNTTTLYKALCGNNPYDPAEKECVNGRLNEVYTDTREMYEDGIFNKYGTASIGNLLWMENMRARVSSSAEADNVCGGADNDCNARGRLYTLSSAKAVCPDGWRLPSTTDWLNLFCTANQSACNQTYNGGDLYLNNSSQIVNELKNSYNLNMINSGYYSSDNHQKDESGNAMYWAERGSEAVIVKWDGNQLGFHYFMAEYGASVRCVKDVE